MNYQDWHFAVFFAVVFGLYYSVSSIKAQTALLIVASLFFYAWESPALLGVFLCSWLITGLTSYWVLVVPRSRAKVITIAGVITNLALLAFFKYKFLFIVSLPGTHSGPTSLGEWLLMAPLPIGISFYTFHGISLLVDVYRSDKNVMAQSARTATGHLLDTLLYLVFFPALIAGPIIKAKEFFPQVTVKRIDDIDFGYCARVLILGFFLKSVIADNLSEQTFWIAYPYFQWKSSADLLIMLFGYSAQIFADFAGYSLIAIGFGALLGYRLPQNFDFPYLSESISEFWGRWHMSLSNWLRDYLYIPLGGSRRGTVRTYANLMTVMLLGGLWHGAALSFAVWGFWHGLGLVIERPWLKTSLMLNPAWWMRAIRVTAVFSFVSVGWLFFKLQDFSHAWLFLGTLISSETPGVDKKLALLIGTYGAAVFLYHAASLYREAIPRQAKDLAYGTMLFLIVTSGGPVNPFIYFQF